MYRTPEDIAALLDLIEPVSVRTYQARLLGLGIQRGGYIANQLLEGARRGYARCYLLAVDGAAVAWQLGYIYGDKYYAHHVGYHPNWRRW